MPLARVTLSLLFFCAFLYADAQQWSSLIQHEDLSQWTIKGGEATFTIENDIITAHCMDDSQNTFLCTKSEYQDFILEFDILVDSTVNSGVQIRSHSLPEYKNGRVHGLQVEVDPSIRKFSGGIYDEARRMWLYPMSLNPEATTAFHNGQWNHFRVQAKGNAIQTWINGVSCANLVDEYYETGFIALQAHSVGSKADFGKTVQWRNIRILTKDINKYLIPTSAPVKRR